MTLIFAMQTPLSLRPTLTACHVIRFSAGFSHGTPSARRHELLSEFISAPAHYHSIISITNGPVQTLGTCCRCAPTSRLALHRRSSHRTSLAHALEAPRIHLRAAANFLTPLRTIYILCTMRSAALVAAFACAASAQPPTTFPLRTLCAALGYASFSHAFDLVREHKGETFFDGWDFFNFWGGFQVVAHVATATLQPIQCTDASMHFGIVYRQYNNRRCRIHQP